MAIIKGNGSLSGHVGQLVFRELNGQQVVQSMPTQYRDANTPAQQRQRSGMRNILVTYRLLKQAIKIQFEEATPVVRPYNCFVHHNLLLPAVDLSKTDYEMHLGILAPYIVSNGSLPPLDVIAEGDTIKFEMKAEDWKTGDTMRLIRVESIDPEAVGPTQLSAHYTDIIISRPEDQCIVSDHLPHGAYTYIHLRSKTKGYLVSSQYLTLL